MIIIGYINTYVIYKFNANFLFIIEAFYNACA